MYWYEEEYCYEPTEADEIFIEAKEKLEKALKESVQLGIDRTVEENRRLSEENKNLKERMKHIDTERRELESKRDKIYQEAKKDVEKEFSLGFYPNQKVFYAKASYKAVECPVCQGQGHANVELFGKIEKVKCTNCKGGGNVSKANYSPYEDTITSIEFSLCRQDWTSKKAELRHGKIWLEKKEWSMDKSRAEEELFHSKEECQKYCDKKNNKS